MPSLLSFNNRQKALQEYSSISEQLPSTNFAMKRDVQEGQARCLAHLGRHEEALEMAADLVSGSVACSPTLSCTKDRKTNLLLEAELAGRDSRRKQPAVYLLS